MSDLLTSFTNNLVDTLIRYAKKKGDLRGECADTAQNRVRSEAKKNLKNLVVQTSSKADSGEQLVRLTDTELNSLRGTYPSLFMDVYDYGRADALAPFVISGNSVITLRGETRARRITHFFQRSVEQDAPSRDIFSGITDTLDIWQKVAIFACVYNPVTLITGGAGTGKTTTLVQAIAALQKYMPQATIRLAAPTGKAAKRLQDVFLSADLVCQTLHQLLGIREDTALPYYHSNRLLDCDVLVIDEASMIGQVMFSLILDALPKHAKLILIGDENQLPPVEAAPIFHPIVRQPYGYSQEFSQLFNHCFNESFPMFVPSLSPASLTNVHVKLTKTFRFGDTISHLASSVLGADLDMLRQIVSMPVGIADTIMCEMETLAKDAYALKKHLIANTIPIVLCITRRGENGTNTLNARIDDLFREKLHTSSIWYAGRKIMIEKNDYVLDVFNGDIGIYTDEGYVDFDGGRSLSVEELPPFSLAFAITIHKSQGSEYDHVLVAYSAFNEVLVSRELLYTAITRAKESVKVFTEESTLRLSLQSLAIDEDRVTQLLNSSA